MVRAWIIGFILAFSFSQNIFAEIPIVRAGVLKFGTVNWELEIIKKYRLDQAEGFKLEVVPFAGKLATATALHGGAVDVIVSDWIWVSRQRQNSRNYGFIPYSRMNGAMMTSPNAGITDLKHLKDKKIGIAGGPVDKNWLLVQALVKKELGKDLSKLIDPIYGAPPLLSKKLERGELDAVITFWHYAAKLESSGHHRFLDIKDVLAKLGMAENIPMIGYVFTPSITQSRPSLIQAFDRASRKAKNILANQNEAWETVKPMMRAKSESSFNALKEGFIKGAPNHWGDQERQAAKDLYALLAEIGGKKLVGKSSELDAGTFVDNVRY